MKRKVIKLLLILFTFEIINGYFLMLILEKIFS